jgi:hypothetical protein
MTLLVVRRRRIDGLETLDLETYPLLVWLDSLAYSIFLRRIPTLTSSVVPARHHPDRLDHLRGVLVAGVARDELVGSVSFLVPESKGAEFSCYGYETDLF